MIKGYINQLLSDSLSKFTDTVKIKIIPDSNSVEWEPFVLIIATLSLMAAVLIPFIQKKHEESRTRRNFRYYFKKQLEIIFNLIVNKKIEYINPSSENDIPKQLLSPVQFLKKFEFDLKKDFESISSFSFFRILMNLQNLLQYTFKLRYAIKKTEFTKLTERILEHCKELPTKELSNAYETIIYFENFVNITLLHDKFGNLNSIKRDIREDIWFGLIVENSFLEKQEELLKEDIKYIKENIESVNQIIGMIKIVDLKTKKYFKYNEI